MPVSITYILTALLTFLGLENAESVANAIIIVVTAIGVLWGRYRAGGINVFGLRK